MDDLPTQGRAEVLFLIGGHGAAALADTRGDLATAARSALRERRIPRWPAPAPAGDAGGMVVTEAFTTLGAESRACVALSTLAGATDDDLARVFGCALREAARRRALALSALAGRVAEAEPDNSAALPDTAAIGDALRDLAARGLAAPITAAGQSRRWPAAAGLAATLGVIVVAAAGLLSPMAPGPETASAGARLVDGGRLVRVGRSAIVDAAWSPDGARIAAAATTGLYTLDATSLLPLAHAPEPRAPTLLGFSPDGAQLAEWTSGALLIRESATLRAVRVVTPAFAGELRAVAYDWNRDRLALGGERELRYYRAGAEERVTGGVNGLAELLFSRDGAWLAMRGRAAEVPVENADTGERRAMVTGTFAPLAMTFSGDGRHLVTLVPAGAQIMDLPSGTTRFVATRAVVAPPLWVNGDGTRAAALDALSGPAGAERVVFDLGSGGEAARERLPTAELPTLWRSRNDGERLLVAGADGLAVWNLARPQLAAVSADFAPPIRQSRPVPVSFSPGGRALVSARPFGGLQWLDAGAGRLVRAIGEGGDTVTAIAVGANRIAAVVVDQSDAASPGRGGAAQRGSPTASVYDAASGVLTHILPGARRPQFAADGRLLYMPLRRDEIRQLDFSSGDSRLTPGPSGERLDDFRASADGRRVVALTERGLELWSADGRVWETPLIRPTHDRNLSDAPLAAPSDLAWIALAEPGQGVVVFDGASGDGRATLARPITVTYEAGTDNPLKIAASADGRWLAVADNRVVGAPQSGATLTVWGMPRQEIAVQLTELPEPVAGLAFAPDGRQLAYSTADYTLRFADLP